MTTTRLPVHAVPCHTRHTALHPRRMAQCHRNTHTQGMYCGEHKGPIWVCIVTRSSHTTVPASVPHTRARVPAYTSLQAAFQHESQRSDCPACSL